MTMTMTVEMMATVMLRLPAKVSGLAQPGEIQVIADAFPEDVEVIAICAESYPVQLTNRMATGSLGLSGGQSASDATRQKRCEENGGLAA
ncbi:hypothetical protein AK812_SmicGene40086 [Symbiodinium microadriaticum]|uniref:Uncharacterized protein n=1 Tax=Symbiodinium microadriaticum TaxID=2951 RepID=A0A1Q9C9N4_SYMMI|nr:hypothetical protein AK812_SmicGene40086 [Symbiodinium microadriaticum]